MSDVQETKEPILRGLKNKKKLLDMAELLDAYRLVPRILVGAYGFMVYKTVIWFMALAEPSTQQVTFISTVVGAAAVVIGMYTNSGRKWQ